ncbi:fibronectin type III domain-containing protein [Haliovirga abyssi]|uniref:Fibronectin type-III domain-containing protein n=1 Tax=Haliovirga abyssi TaxID=2996794 RepID=A0AAU9E093_9FUSO|nr:fibronectin type III domain-containing protein [Haliovirga abyssi]BDU51305.1 hypothetical protein HLVA_18740 [Haliovirga abyssi]
MKNIKMKLLLLLAILLSTLSFGEVAATHIYHNHMPNFWPFYDVETYNSTNVGDPVRYMYDGQVINAKINPPANWFFLPDGSATPHDDLVAYYTHHAKTGAYLSWPMDTANGNHDRYPKSQTQVTMSGAVITNVESFAELNNVSGYENDNWGQYWRDVHYGTRTTNGFPALDLIHFTGHHSMGPLVGKDFFLKDLIYQNVVLSRPYFLGDGFKSSKGYFPTELGFSERLIPTLAKLGVSWSVLGNVHYSRALKDYPYLNDPGKDCLVSPPNRADMRNTDTYGGSWVDRHMFNEQQTTYNKFPFASIPHYVRYIDPETGAESKIAGIPVEQAGSWEEGYQGSVSGGFLKQFEGNTNGREQYFVVAHDGDNSSGRAGDGGTWANSGNVTYAESGIEGIGVDEYLLAHPIPQDDIVHVQDGSWIDTRDSSSDPTWYHWHIPMGIWKGQFADFNRINGTNYSPKKNLDGVEEGHTVSFEYGYHYLERNFALLQAAENYAKTAEQIWLDSHPNYWHPTSQLDYEIVGANNTANQLNPYMYSFPVKGDSNNDYAGGANPAELGWYFLTASIDSGFGYYDENVDDGVKPTVSFDQSLYFSKPYVEANLANDKTGPSVWWPQRYPYNPGSANKSKAEGWTLQYFDNNFGIYTYAFDASGIQNIKVKIRTHSEKWADPKDRTYQVYDPQKLSNQGVPEINPANVGNWVEYPMTKRSLQDSINGVDWQPSGKEMMNIVSAQEIGDMYYSYIGDYRDQLIDYYIEATDSKGNITKSNIQQVYVGAGKYKNVDDKIIEDVNGTIEGTYPFVTNVSPERKIDLYVENIESNSVNVEYVKEDGSWSSMKLMDSVSADPKYKHTVITFRSENSSTKIRYTDNNGSSWKPSASGVDVSTGTYTIYSDNSIQAGAPSGISFTTTIYYKGALGTNIHWAPTDEAGTPIESEWTIAPGDPMETSDIYGYVSKTLNLGMHNKAMVCFNQSGSNWDSDHLFNSGTWTYEAGVITSGKPSEVINYPAIPSGVAGTALSISELKINWDSAQYATSYKLYMSSSTNGVFNEITDTTNLEYTVTGLNENTTYYFKAKSFNSNGESDYSNVISATTQKLNYPEIPSGVAGTALSTSELKISWDNAQYATSYKLYMSSSTNGVFNEITDTTNLEYTVTGLNENTTYYFKAKAFNSNGESDYSNVISATTQKQAVDGWFIRGSFNSWGTDALTFNSSNGKWEITITTGNGDSNGGPRFKIDHFGDWSENYPNDDYSLDTNSSYKIEFDASSKAITATLQGNPADNWYIRGSFNGWGTDALSFNSSTGKWEITVTTGNGDSNGGPRFKIDHFGDWSENYPNADYGLNSNSSYIIEFDASSKAITATLQ